MNLRIEFEAVWVAIARIFTGRQIIGLRVRVRIRIRTRIRIYSDRTRLTIVCDHRRWRCCRAYG
jgi:hypothetical protein